MQNCNFKHRNLCNLSNGKCPGEKKCILFCMYRKMFPEISGTDMQTAATALRKLINETYKNEGTKARRKL